MEQTILGLNIVQLRGSSEINMLLICQETEGPPHETPEDAVEFQQKLTASIRRCRSWKHLQRTCEQQWGSLNVIHISAALRRLVVLHENSKYDSHLTTLHHWIIL